MESGRWCAPMNALASLKFGGISLIKFTLLMRKRKKEGKLSKQGNFGKLSLMPKYKLEHHIWCIKMLAIGSQISKT
jgi:hypothetical protein